MFARRWHSCAPPMVAFSEGFNEGSTQGPTVRLRTRMHNDKWKLGSLAHPDYHTNDATKIRGAIRNYVNRRRLDIRTLISYSSAGKSPTMFSRGVDFRPTARVGAATFQAPTTRNIKRTAQRNGSKKRRSHCWEEHGHHGTILMFGFLMRTTLSTTPPSGTHLELRT